MASIAAVTMVFSGLTLTATSAHAEPQPAGDPLLVASDDGVVYHFVAVPDSAGYQFEVTADGKAAWGTRTGAVGVTLQGKATVYSPYSEVSSTEDGHVAKAEVTVGAGTVVDVTDTYSTGNGGVEISRSFVVSSVGSGDAGKGISVTYPFADYSGKAPGNYEWFSPGSWYGNDSMTFTDRNKMAFDGTETSLPVDAMTAPLVTAFDTASGYAMTLSDRTPGERETIAADKEPQTAKTLVDARINLPSLGLRSVSATGGSSEVFQTYPGYDKNYRNRTSSKPALVRMLPVSVGLARTTGVAISFEKYGDFDSMVKGVWRAAYAHNAQIVDQVDTKTHFDTLVDYIDNSYGTADGKRIYASNYALLQTSSGFLWRQADLAYVELAQGWSRQDEEMKTRARNVINDQIDKGGLNPSNNNQRTRAEAYTAVMNAYLADKRNGVTQSRWLDVVKTYADSLPTTSKGSISLTTTDLTIWAVPVLLDLASETGNSAYLEKARTAGNATWAVQSKDMHYVGSLEDYAGGPTERDREMGLTSLEAYMALYRSATTEAEKQQWLSAAKVTADYAETWMIIDNRSTNPVDATSDLVMYGNDHVRPYGISEIHAGAAGGDVAASYYSAEFFELGEATGDKHYTDMAQYIEKNSMLYTNMGDKYGQMADPAKGSGLGFTNEYLGTAANDYWNNNQRGDGNASNIGWATYMLVGMTQKDLDRLDRYTVATPTVSTINGLNMYYRLVNKATGLALDVSGRSIVDGANLTGTSPEASTGVSTQQWLLEPLGDGTFKVVNRMTARAMRIAGDSTAVAARATQAVPMPGQALGFTFTQSADGSYTVSNRTTGKVLEINDTDPSGVAVQQNTVTGSDYQRWDLVPVGDVQILDRSDSRALSASAGAGGAAGVSRTAFDDDATLSQRWTFVPSIDGYMGVVSRSTGLALEADGSTLSVAPSSEVDDAGFLPTQQWKVSLDGTGYFTLTSRQGYSLTVSDDSGVVLSSGTVSDSNQLRLTTAGPATVESPAGAVTSDLVTASTVVGTAPALPTTVGVTASDGTRSSALTTWDLSTIDVSTAGTYRVLGRLAGTGVVARARVAVVPESGITSVETATVTTPVGTAPTLPSTVKAHTAGGRTVLLPVKWKDVDAHSYDTEGVVTVTGVVAGTSIEATARVTVTDAAHRVADVDIVQVRTKVGASPVLPDQVDVTFEDGSRGKAPVTWSPVDASAYSKAGYVTIDGTVPAYGGLARAFVTVAQVINPFSAGNMSCWKSGGNGSWNDSTTGLSYAGNTNDQSSWAVVCDPTDPSKPLTVANGIIEADVRLTDTYGNGGLWVRSDSVTKDANGYYLGLEEHTTKYVAGKQVNGQWTAQNQWAYVDTGRKGDQTRHLKVVADGQHLQFYVDDMTTPKLTRDDSSFSSGYVGVRTWRSGAQVTAFVVRPLTTVVSASDTQASTSVGTTPSLPATVSVIDSAGDVASAPVTWNPVDPKDYSRAGSFTVAGTAGGVSVHAVVTVSGEQVGSTFSVPLTLTDPGAAPTMPSNVRENLPDGSSKVVDVTWQIPDASAFSTSGSYVAVSGTTKGGQPVTGYVAVSQYSDSFASTGTQGWNTFGGTWKVAGSVLGVTKSSQWGQGEKATAATVLPDDFIYQGTVKVTDGSQAGLLFRVTNPSVGGDAYNGYYAGIDTSAGKVILGKANGQWTQIATSDVVPGIAQNTAVTIRIVARGSHLQVFVGDMLTPVIDTVDSTWRSGTVGVRGWASSYGVSDLMVAPLAKVSGVRPVTAETVGGVAPGLPSTVTVEYADGTEGQAAVTWKLDDLDYSTSPLTVTGTVEGTDIPATATITIAAGNSTTSTATVKLTTPAGQAPQLPDTVVATRADGSTHEAAVTWTVPDPSRYASEGSVLVIGHLTDEPEVVAHAAVFVTAPSPDPHEIVSVDAVAISTQVGTAPLLPAVVGVLLRDGSPSSATVTWDAVPDSAFGTVGTFTVSGKVTGTDLPATATVEVTPAAVGAGSLKVHAVFGGEARSLAPGQVSAHVTCSLDGTPVDLGTRGTLALSEDNGFAARVDSIPLGASCQVTQDGETGSVGETSRSTSPDDGIVEITQQGGSADDVPESQTVTLTDRYDWSGGFVLHQVVTGPSGTDVSSAGPMGYTVSCVTSDGRAINLGSRARFSVSNGQSFALGSAVVSIGSTCTVTSENSVSDSHTVFTIGQPDATSGSALVSELLPGIAVGATQTTTTGEGIIQLKLTESAVDVVATTVLSATGGHGEGPNDGSATGGKSPVTGSGGELAVTGLDSGRLLFLLALSALLMGSGLAVVRGASRGLGSVDGRRPRH